MKIKKQFLLRGGKCLLWATGFVILFIGITKVLQPKYYFQTEAQSPETEIWSAFYEEEKQTLDILFLGSSHVYNAVNPVVFYEETGLRSFALASSSQDFPTSYFYLKEALRFQQPEYVVMDVYGILYKAFGNEACYKRSLDNMKWSDVKLEAVRAWQEHLPEERLMSRVFTIMDYHSRWESLKQEDFDGSSYVTNVNGYCPEFGTDTTVHHDTFECYDNLPELDAATLGYFEQIKQLCEAQGIKLLTCAFPDTSWTLGYSKAAGGALANFGVPFVDYNVAEQYGAIGIDDRTDWMNKSHLNVYGAEKFTRYLAEDLLERNWIEHTRGTAQTEKVWEEKTTAWTQQYESGIFPEITDLKDYLTKLAETDYSIFMAVRDEGTKGLDEEIIAKLQNLGLSDQIYGKSWQSYYAVIREDEAAERVGEELLTIKGVLRDGKTRYEVSSAGAAYGDFCSVKIGDTECAVNSRGMNIVVYDEKNGRIVDSVCFDTNVPECTVKR